VQRRSIQERPAIEGVEPCTARTAAVWRCRAKASAGSAVRRSAQRRSLAVDGRPSRQPERTGLPHPPSSAPPKETLEIHGFEYSAPSKWWIAIARRRDVGLNVPDWHSALPVGNQRMWQPGRMPPARSGGTAGSPVAPATSPQTRSSAVSRTLVVPA